MQRQQGTPSPLTPRHATTVEPPKKEAPGAGFVPDWEGRSGLPESEFLKSDDSKPDLSGMWECPLTRWDSEGYATQAAVFPPATYNPHYASLTFNFSATQH